MVMDSGKHLQEINYYSLLMTILFFTNLLLALMVLEKMMFLILKQDSALLVSLN
jgi:hypothetical protein